MVRNPRMTGIPVCLSVGLAILVLLPLEAVAVAAAEGVDVVSAVLESPIFRGKDPLSKLKAAADLVRSNTLKQQDLSFALLDWADQHLRTPSDALERLRRWSELTNDEKLAGLRLPRDFLNRLLLGEFLAESSSYQDASPRRRLEILSKMEQEQLVDWSVFLAYARIYAGGILAGAQSYKNTSALEALIVLRDLNEAGLVGWHYRVPTEAVLAGEALALDPEFRSGEPEARLARLGDLEHRGIISKLTRAELERLPAWRVLVNDSSFLKARPPVRKKRILDMKTKGLISNSTAEELSTIFSPVTIDSPTGMAPAPLPAKGIGPGKPNSTR